MLKKLSANPERVVRALLYVYVAWLVLQIFVSKFGMDALTKAAFLDSIAATAYRPFVYRALVPAIVRSIAHIIPGPVGWQIEEIIGQPEILPTHSTGYTIEYIAFSLLAWGCFVGFAYAIRCLTRHFYPTLGKGIIDYGVPLTALLVIPLFFRHFNFVYDPATILLFPVALVCLIRERYLLYFLVLALCALNKETSVLLIPAFVVYKYQRGMKPYWIALLAIVQLAICLGIYKYITHSFADRPGEQMEIQLVKYNLWLVLRLPFAFMWFIGVVSVFSYFTAKDWKTKPAFLRYSLVLMMIPHVASLLVVGCIDEIRVFYEVYAILILLMVPSIVRMAQTLLTWKTAESVAEGT